VRGRGQYIGTYVGIAALERYWWGEGEMKFYLDGDVEYPTICGTGTEDYFGVMRALKMENLKNRISVPHL
jgi:hypothetical protein